MPRFPCPTPDKCGVKSHNNPGNCLGSTTSLDSSAANPELLVLSHSGSMSDVRKLSDGEHSKAVENFISNDTDIGDQITISFRSKDENDAEFAFDTLDEIRNDFERITKNPNFLVHRYDQSDPQRIHITCNISRFSKGDKETDDPPPLSETIRELDGFGLIDEDGIRVTNHIKQLSAEQKLIAEAEAKNVDFMTGVDESRFGEFYDTKSLNTPSSFTWAMSVRDEDSVIVKLGQRDYPTRVDISMTDRNDGHETISYNEDQLDRLLDDGGYTSKEDRELAHQSMREVAKIKMMQM